MIGKPTHGIYNEYDCLGRHHHDNRFSPLVRQADNPPELASGKPFGPPPGLSKPSCRERKQAR
eukprot:11281482-Heterocapsa_arctica.AAC.1